MRPINIILWRELQRQATSLISYLIAAAFLLLTAFWFYYDLSISLTNKATAPAAVPQFLTGALVFFAPMMTMRALAEEKREGTLELMLTAPVTDAAIVIGKFLAVWAFYTLLLLITYSYQWMLLAVGQQPDLGHAIAAYVGVWLYGGAALAIGVMFSASTENQIVAAFLSSTTLMLFYLGDFIGLIVPNVALAALLREISFQGHFSTTFGSGVILLHDIVYFSGVIVLALFISTRTIEAQRWG